MSNSKRLITKSASKNTTFSQDNFIMLEGMKVLGALVGFMFLVSLIGCEAQEGTPIDGNRYCNANPELCE